MAVKTLEVLKQLPWILFSLLLLLMAATLSKPVLHTDEIASLLSVNARSTTEVYEKLKTTQGPNAIKDLHQWLVENKEAKLKDVITRHLKEEPQFSPLYPSLAFLWSRALPISDTLLALRIFSFLWALLALWFFYKLYQKFLGEAPRGSVFLALAANPALWLLAREARFYSMWLCLVVASWYLALELVHLATRKKLLLWLLLTLLAVNLQVLHFVVLVSQVLYLFIWHKKLWLKSLVVFVLALLSYAPWAYLASQSSQTYSNMPHLFSKNPQVFSGIFRNASRMLWDFDISRASSLSLQYGFSGAILLFFILIFALATKKLKEKRNGARELAFFLLPVLLLWLSDLLLKTSFTNLQRYLTPLVPALCLLLVWICHQKPHGFFSRLILPLWLVGGLSSCICVVISPYWRTHPFAHENASFVKNWKENLPDRIFYVDEHCHHLSTTQPQDSEFIKALRTLGPIMAFYYLTPEGDRPSFKWR